MKGKSKIGVIVGAIIVIIVAAILFVTLNKGDQTSSYTQPSGSSSPSMSGSEGSPVTGTDGSGQYIDYSEQALANAQGKRWLFFHAVWCPQCRALEQDIKSMGAPDGVTIFKVDYDNSRDLKQKYGVTLQTTIVEVDEQGNKVNSFVAYDDPSLSAVVQALGG